MRAIEFNTGWTCKHLEEKGPGRPVTIPHDAMREERRNASAPGGVNSAWYEGFDYCYQKEFIPEQEWKDQCILLEFEGVYHNAEVYLNEEKVAFRPYGYTNFYVDLTGRLRFGDQNSLKVIARNADQPNCRWYSGAGIYRPVRMWISPKRHIDVNGIRVRTLSLSPVRIEVCVKTMDSEVCASSASDSEAAQALEAERASEPIRVEILDGNHVIASARMSGRTQIELPELSLWSEENPQLYTCRAAWEGDEAEVSFGVRMLEWGKEGLLLNGERIILQGACIHHDNGLLGAACEPDAVARKVRLLKENGYNAIRSAHNPASKALLEECDRQGMFLMDEYVDQWYIHKNRYDYAGYFEKWWRQDLTDMVEKDFNHPCVILYSTGNEVSETAQKRGIALTKEMTDFLHSLDSTRPVTCGVNIFFNFLSSVGFGVYSDEKAKKEAQKSEKSRREGKAKKEKAVGSQFFNNLAGLLGDEFMKRGATLHGCDVKTRDAFANMDIAGYNYGIYRYDHDLKKYPDRLILGSETFCNDAYRFREMAKGTPRLIGDFVWAGMDYLGETMVGSWEYADYAANFDGTYGWISAGSGRIDLTGKPLGEALYTRVALEKEPGPYIAVRPVNHTKDRHSPSAWKMTDAMPSWSFEGCDGKKASVEVYARAARVELYVNGKQVGSRELKDDCRARFSCAYESGSIEAVAYDSVGCEIGRDILRTAGAETVLKAEPEQRTAHSGQLCYIRLRYTDKNGILKPLSRGTITVRVTGGELLALGSACPYNERGYLRDETDTYYGEALAIVRAGDTDILTLSATDQIHECEVGIFII